MKCIRLLLVSFSQHHLVFPSYCRGVKKVVEARPAPYPTVRTDAKQVCVPYRLCTSTNTLPHLDHRLFNILKYALNVLPLIICTMYLRYTYRTLY
jgi:hypothetical protein